MTLTPFGPDLWYADGDGVEPVPGFHYPTRMVVIRRPDGRLWLWSPVTLTDALHDAVTALGRVADIVAPNKLHHLALSDWCAAHPDATLHLPPGLADKRPDLPAGRALEARPDWGDDLDHALFRGNLIAEEAVFFHVPSRTALVADLLQQVPEESLTGWRRTVARADRMTGDRPQMPRKFRLAFGLGRRARPAARRVLGWPAERLLIAHGPPVARDAASILRAAISPLA